MCADCFYLVFYVSNLENQHCCMLLYCSLYITLSPLYCSFTFSLCLNFMYLFYVYVYALYELFFVDNVVRLLFYVNKCACHVYFTINLLTYLDGVDCGDCQ